MAEGEAGPVGAAPVPDEGAEPPEHPLTNSSTDTTRAETVTRTGAFSPAAAAVSRRSGRDRDAFDGCEITDTLGQVARVAVGHALGQPGPQRLHAIEHPL